MAWCFLDRRWTKDAELWIKLWIKLGDIIISDLLSFFLVNQQLMMFTVENVSGVDKSEK